MHEPCDVVCPAAREDVLGATDIDRVKLGPISPGRGERAGVTDPVDAFASSGDRVSVPKIRGDYFRAHLG